MGVFFVCRKDILVITAVDVVVDIEGREGRRPFDPRDERQGRSPNAFTYLQALRRYASDVALTPRDVDSSMASHWCQNNEKMNVDHIKDPPHIVFMEFTSLQMCSFGLFSPLTHALVSLLSIPAIAYFECPLSVLSQERFGGGCGLRYCNLTLLGQRVIVVVLLLVCEAASPLSSCDDGSEREDTPLSSRALTPTLSPDVDRRTPHFLLFGLLSVVDCCS